MLQEQEQRILGYFINEAKDHLHTIEQGLLNLHDTLEDTEMVNEVFRAAHSLKGGAAMLGLDSIQQTAHHLEDYFKILKECPTVAVDQKSESLFLRVFDALKELIEHLEESFGLSQDVVNNIMLGVKPVFETLNQHLDSLVNQPAFPSTEINLQPVFQSQVMQNLRDMLQLFKQPETPQNRQQLQKRVEQLAQLGKQFQLFSWYSLCKTAVSAIAVTTNTYRILAPIIIKELKQAQELVLADREAKIKTSKQLQALSNTNAAIIQNN